MYGVELRVPAERVRADGIDVIGGGGFELRRDGDDVVVALERVDAVAGGGQHGLCALRAPQASV